MLRNYLKVAFRSLRKNSSYVVLNVLGLSVAIAICIVNYLNYTHSTEANREHSNYERIYKVNGWRISDGNRQGIGISPMPLAPLVSQITSVKGYSRYEKREEIIHLEDEVLGENVAYVDEDFLEIFTFPGRGDMRIVPGSILISQDMSTRLFGEVDPVGREIRLLINQKEHLYRIGGVLDPVPTNSSFRFDALMSFENYFDHYPESNGSDWSQWVDGTFVMLSEASHKSSVEGSISRYLSNQREANTHLPFEGYYLDRLDHWAQDEINLLHRRFWTNMAPAALWGLNSSAILILILSCFNFTNTSISFSNKRLKEIGVRKVFGGSRGQLIIQFLLENLMLIVLAMIMGLVLAEMLIPMFNNLFWFLHIELDFMSNLGLLLFLLTLMVIVAIFSAVYPALYVSSFKPVNIFQGKAKFGGGNTFLKILVAGQFIITVYNVFMGIVFYQNSQYQTSLDQGYDLHKTIVVPLVMGSDYTKLQNRLLSEPLIDNMAGSNTQLAFSTDYYPLKYENADLEVGWLKVGYDYIETMGIEVLEGRSFDEDIDGPGARPILVNQQLVNNLGWVKSNDAIGRRLFMDSTYYTVVGVVNNFHERMIMRGGDIRPVVINLVEPKEFNFLTVRSNHASLSEVNSKIRTAWFEIFPLAPYEAYYQSRALEAVNDTNRIINSVNLFVIAVSILLSSMGLYTLVSLDIIKRIKEIGIRKVLGASVNSIIGLLNQSFAKLLGLGVILGSISGYFIINWLLDIIYAYRLPVDLWPMLFAGLLLVIVSFSTIGLKIYGAAKMNPVNHLRNE